MVNGVYESTFRKVSFMETNILKIQCRNSKKQGIEYKKIDIRGKGGYRQIDIYHIDI